MTHDLYVALCFVSAHLQFALPVSPFVPCSLHPVPALLKIALRCHQWPPYQLLSPVSSVQSPSAAFAFTCLSLGYFLWIIFLLLLPPPSHPPYLFFISRQISPSLLIALRISTSSQGISHLFRGKSLGNRLFPLWLLPVAGSWVIKYIFWQLGHVRFNTRSLHSGRARAPLPAHGEAPGLSVAACPWWW